MPQDPERLNSKYCLILCTCPDQAAAERIASALVSRHLAACVNILPGLTSIYLWAGTIEKDPELLLLIKSEHGRYSEVEQTILELHPYELPEVIAVPVAQGAESYLNWIDQCLNSKQ